MTEPDTIDVSVVEQSQISMEKRKIAYLRPWWWAAIVGQKFAFDVPIPLEDAAQLLLQHDHRSDPIYAKSRYRRRLMQVTVVPVDKDNARYEIICPMRYIDRHHLPPPVAAAVFGTLTRLSYGTRVTGSGRIGVVPVFILVGIGVIIGAMMLAVPGSVWLVLIYLPLCLSAIGERRRTMYLPYRTLIIASNKRKKKAA